MGDLHTIRKDNDEIPILLSEDHAFVTPTKISSGEELNVSELRDVVRRMGGVTPKSGSRKWGRKEYFNFSIIIHMWAKKKQFPLAEKPLTVKDIEEILDYGGPHGLDLTIEGQVAKTVFKKRYLNGAMRSERFVGNFVGGFTSKDNCHHYPQDCPFLHCSAMSEWFPTKKVPNGDRKSISQLVMSPNSPRDLNILLMKSQEENLTMQKTIESLQSSKESTEVLQESQAETFECLVL